MQSDEILSAVVNSSIGFGYYYIIEMIGGFQLSEWKPVRNLRLV